MNTETFSETPAPRISPRRISVSIALTCGVIATGILSFERLFHIGLPGCGVGSGCAVAAESPFSRIGRVPIAYPGFAYAVAMAFAWIASGRKVTSPLVWAARMGAIVSNFYCVLILEHKFWCGYCVAAHASNLVAWMLLERSQRSPGWRMAAIVLPCVFGIILAGIAFLKPQVDRSYLEERNLGVDAAIESIVNEEARGIEPKRWLPGTDAGGGIRVGSANARIRITVFLDYQCGYCRTVAREVATLTELQGVAITWRQLPHGWPCNARLKSNLHDCACRCARMAMATAGTPDFARVHEWLLARNGICTEDDIEDGLPTLISTDAATFWNRYHSATTRDAIRADLALAERLELHGTPAVFINGVLIVSPNIGEAIRQLAERMPLR